MPNVPYRYVFLASVLKIFARSQVTFEKSRKRKNSQYRPLGSVWAQESVERLSQIKRRLVDLPVPFPYAIYSALKIRGIFKYDILSNYAMSNHCCSWCIQKPNITTVSMKLRCGEIFSWKFVAYRKEARSWKNETIGSLYISGRFETHQRLGWCCVYFEFCSLRKSNFQFSNLQ